MKKRMIGLILSLSFSWTPLFAAYDDEYLDSLLANPEVTLYTLRTSVSNHKEDTNYEFNPDHLNLIGSLARRQYDNEIASNPLPIPDLSESVHPGEVGHIDVEEYKRNHRFETISRYVHTKLREVYGNKILENPVRVINNVGGIFATMEIYSCSTKEYLALFGTLMKQNGYSGRYAYMKVWDIMVDGIMLSHGIDINATMPVSYGPGEVSLLGKKERRLYKTTAGALMIDYGRGFILPAFWQGVILPYKNNADFDSFKDQIVQCAKSFFTN